MRMTLRGLMAAGLAAAGFLMTTSATAQEMSQYERVVIEQLAAIVPQMAQRGYPNYELIGFNAINNGANETINYATRDTSDIVLIGVCDSDCTDVDLRVRGSSGVIGEDVLADDVPIVPVTATERPLTVNVIMTACSQNPCVYGVAVFRR